MRLAKTMCGAVVGIILLSSGETASAAKPQVDNFALANGIRVASLYIADSNNVSIFAFLPMGLASDGPGQGQWSHLIEHLTIRTTVPYASQQANAETLPDHVRLDFYGTVYNWQVGLSHHAKWLKGIPFTEKSLQAEKRHVNSECDVVAKRQATHKFAVAAWAQGYRHGRPHAALKGDINKVTLREIQQYRDQHLAVLDKTVVCVVGGVDAKTIKPIVTEKLGTTSSQAKIAQPVKLHLGNRKMTWDLDARHLMLTWPIPAFAHDDYPALMVASQWLMMKLFMDAELKKLTGGVFAGADLVTPEGNNFFVSASIKREASFDDVRAKIEPHIETLRSGPTALLETAMIGPQLAYQLTNVMDPAIAKAQAPANVSAAMIEGNIGLQWGMREFQYGRHRDALAKGLAAVTAEKVHQAAVKYLAKEKCSVCSIEPKAK